MKNVSSIKNLDFYSRRRDFVYNMQDNALLTNLRDNTMRD